MCTGALTEIGNEQFGFRTVNCFGNGLFLFSRDLTSASDNIDTRFQIGYGARFCISGAMIFEWSSN